MYAVVIGILACVLTMPGPLYEFVRDARQVLALVAAATLLPPAVALVLSRRAIGLLDRHPDQPGLGQAAFNRGMGFVHATLGLCHAGLLLLTDWPLICSRLPVVGGWPVVPGLLSIAPFLLTIMLIWTVIYPADRAVRQIALEMYLLRGRPTRPVWSLARHLQYNLRHQVLFILVPMLLILAASDVVGMYDGEIRSATGLRYAPDVLVGLAAVVVAVASPEILRRVWITQRLSDGPLRDRLLALCRRLRLRCRDILVWRSGGMVVNAAVMGVIAPLRYVLITDAMLEQLDDTRIEAVFGHEAGHVKHHHILCYLLLALISGCLITVFSAETDTIARHDPDHYQVLLVGLGAALVVQWGVIFGWISRRFERQADVHAVRTLAMSGLPCTQPCLMHSNPGPGGAPLCRTAAAVFSTALHEVALLNGIPPEARSWRHSSIASRSRFVHALAENPRSYRRFQRRVQAIQAVILAAAVASAVWAAQAINLWSVLHRHLGHVLPAP